MVKAGRVTVSGARAFRRVLYLAFPIVRKFTAPLRRRTIAGAFDIISLQERFNGLAEGIKASCQCDLVQGHEPRYAKD